MNPLRIGLFTDTFLPDQNGIVTSVCLLSDELRALGHQVDVVAPRFPEHLDRRPDVRRVASVRYPLLPTYRLAWPGRRSFEQRYDLIHTHTERGWRASGGCRTWRPITPTWRLTPTTCRA